MWLVNPDCRAVEQLLLGISKIDSGVSYVIPCYAEHSPNMMDSFLITFPDYKDMYIRCGVYDNQAWMSVEIDARSSVTHKTVAHTFRSNIKVKPTSKWYYMPSAEIKLWMIHVFKNIRPLLYKS
jgi:hypothetical protein